VRRPAIQVMSQNCTGSRAIFVALVSRPPTRLLFYRSAPAVEGNRLSPGPLERLGGSHSVNETVEAIEDVSTWCP
jgi:hypothetical protein